MLEASRKALALTDDRTLCFHKVQLAMIMRMLHEQNASKTVSMLTHAEIALATSNATLDDTASPPFLMSTWNGRKHEIKLLLSSQLVS